MPSKNGSTKDRTIGRRQNDHFIHEQAHRLGLITRVGQIVTSVINMDELFDVIIEQTNSIMETERSSIFLHDAKKDFLWSLVATGMQKDRIRFPISEGIAGRVFAARQPLIINDPYSDPRFYNQIDKDTGFITRNILCIPIINRNSCCIGVFQTLNKKSGEFDNNDMELLVSLSHYVAIALENAGLYEDLKRLDRAKERIINHLSHELKTPLTIIMNALSRFSRLLESAGIENTQKTFARAQRNINRLLDLQKKIDDIVNQREFGDMTGLLNIIESAASIVGDIQDHSLDNNEMISFIDKVSERLESLLPDEKVQIEAIPLDSFLHAVCDTAVMSMQGRKLDIIRNVKSGLVLVTDRVALQKSCSGLLKNAIENTPDGGKIEVGGFSSADGIVIAFRDYGIGISEENKKNIFSGFFHTIDTNLYSSKSPYEFNAGGAGADLLRIKAFSERYGFFLDLESTRCPHIPSDNTMCPGSVFNCHYIQDASQCLNSGGSTFTLRFAPQE